VRRSADNTSLYVGRRLNIKAWQTLVSRYISSIKAHICGRVIIGLIGMLFEISYYWQ
jgi:hypothetical protein